MFIAYWKNKKQENKEGRKMKAICQRLVILTLVAVLTSFYTPQHALAVSVKDAWTTVKTVIEYAYDGLGRLVGQTQTITSSGADLQGNNFKSTSTIDYDIKLGKAIATHRNTASEQWHENGSWSKTIQDIHYQYDENGALQGAWGEEKIEGRTEDYYIPKDKFIELGGKMDSGAIVDGTPIDKDLDGKNGVEENEKSLIKIRGNTYSGTAKLKFIIIDGEAYVSHREQTLEFKSSIKNEVSFTRATNIDYKYAVKGGKVVLTDTEEVTKDTYTQVYTYTDENGKVKETDTHLFQSKYIKTHYEYDNNGNLVSASGKGYGWGLVEASIGFAVYTSDITVTYDIVNGQASMKKYEEEAFYTPAQNPPDPIPTPVRSSDPQGTIIDKFKIHTSHVGNGNQNAGQYNEYEWLVVRVKLNDAGDPTAADDGNPDNDKVFLVRIRTHAGTGQAVDGNTFENLKDYYKVGGSIGFNGEALPTRDINNNLHPHRIWKYTGAL